MVRIIVAVIGALIGAVALYYETDIRSDVEIRVHSIAVYDWNYNFAGHLKTYAGVDENTPADLRYFINFNIRNSTYHPLKAEAFILLETEKKENRIPIQKTFTIKPSSDPQNFEIAEFEFNPPDGFDLDNVYSIAYCVRFYGPFYFDNYNYESHDSFIKKIEPYMPFEVGRWETDLERRPSGWYDRSLGINALCESRTLMFSGLFDYGVKPVKPN